jgi:hypothetical protein
MKPTTEQIKEIFNELDLGLLCYFNVKTGNIVSFPDPDLIDSDEIVFWESQIKLVETDRESYFEFNKPSSKESIWIIKEFAKSLSDQDFTSKIYDILDNRKPFSHFRKFIENSKFLEDWYDFNYKQQIEYIKEEIENNSDDFMDLE